MTTLTPWTDVISTATTYLSSIDPVMAETIARVGLCTLEPNPNIFETLVDAIISQQISVKAADAIVARLRVATPGGLITPEALLLLEQDSLRAAGLSTPKARYARDLTERVTGGHLDLAALVKREDEDVIKNRIVVKGIRRWTAETILILSLGGSYVLHVDDLGFI